MTKIDQNAARILVQFITRYTLLLEKNLQDIHGEMRTTVDQVMRGINSISARGADQGMDSELEKFLLDMMGALSRDDVISQRIEHVMTALSAMQVSLTYVLTDFEERCKDTEVEKFATELKGFVFRSYTMEEEKKSFYSIFPEDRKAKKKSA